MIPILYCALLIACALAFVALTGYLAACAGAQRWINFFDWLVLREPKDTK